MTGVGSGVAAIGKTMEAVARKRGNDRDSGYKLDPLGWYVEDAASVDQLLDHEDFSGHLVWDPACGTGNILDRCALRGLDTCGTDVRDRGAGGRHPFQISSFLTDEFPYWNRRSFPLAIVCNPPYGRLHKPMPRGDSYAERFCRRALAHGAEKIAMLVNGKFLWSERRWRLFEVDHPPTQILFLSDRPSMPPGTERERLAAEGRLGKGGSIDFAWLLWVRGAERRAPKWLRPSSAIGIAAGKE
jgi:hypothetical protein